MGTEKMDTKQEQRNKENEEIREMGTMELGKKGNPYGIQLLTIIGEIEGHENVSGNTKATKYEHLLPRLAEAEENDEIEGVLILLNTMGGDVEAGLGIAEMIASLGKPYHWSLEEVILSEDRWLYLQIILLLSRQAR